MSSHSMDGRLSDWLEKLQSCGGCTVVLLWLPPRWPQSAGHCTGCCCSALHSVHTTAAAGQLLLLLLLLL